MISQQIKVAIADDHKIFRDGIRMALKDKDYLKILWEAEDGKDLLHNFLKLADRYWNPAPRSSSRAGKKK